MPSTSEPSRPRPEDRQQPLIAPVPIDAVLASNKQWTAQDRSLTASRRALESGIVKLRERLKAQKLSPAETSGAPAQSPDAAMALLNASDGALTEALQARASARAALDAAYRSAEDALTLVSDVRTARGTIVVIAALLLWLLGMLVW